MNDAVRQAMHVPMPLVRGGSTTHELQAARNVLLRRWIRSWPDCLRGSGADDEARFT